MYLISKIELLFVQISFLLSVFIRMKSRNEFFHFASVLALEDSIRLFNNSSIFLIQAEITSSDRLRIPVVNLVCFSSDVDR